MSLKHSLISNSCASWLIYKAYEKRSINDRFINYPNPFVACWFPDDEAYVRFCENYEHYISLEPRFGKPINLNWEKVAKTKWHLGLGSNSYLVMFLDDIEIHWTHDTNPTLLLQKFKGRLEDSKEHELIFLWSDSEMFTTRTEEERNNLVKRFNAIKNKTIFLTKYPEEEYRDETTIVTFVPAWKNKSLNDRTSWSLLTWYDNPKTSLRYKIVIDSLEKNTKVDFTEIEKKTDEEIATALRYAKRQF